MQLFRQVGYGAATMNAIADAADSGCFGEAEGERRTFDDGLPVHSWHSLIADLATLARNTVTTALAPENRFTLLTRPTPIQHKALQLLNVAL